MIFGLNIMTLIYLIILGGIVGSFINMLVHRLPKNEDIILKRSYCPHCGHKLMAKDLVPIISYLVLLGKCRYCQKHIGVRYILTEIMACILMVVCFMIFGLSHTFFKYFIFLTAMLAVFITDIEQYQIPDFITYPAILIGLILGYMENRFLDAIYGLLIGGLVYLIIGFVGRLIYKKEAMGMGDVKLGAAIGAYWGLKIAILTCYMSFLVGGVFALYLLLVRKKSRKDYLPFGPAIIIALLIAITYGNDIWFFYFGTLGTLL
jgi:leader peptidase (prepilin peptidase)/N-methyltransferase